MNRRKHLTSLEPAARALRLAGPLTLLAVAVAGCGSAHHQPAKSRGVDGQTVARLGTEQAAAARSHDRIARRVSASRSSLAPAIAAGPVIRTLSGDGNRAIGSLTLKRAVVLQWNSSTPRLQLFTAQGIVLVDASSPAGRVRLAGGDYSGLRVATPGRWTVQLRLAP